MQLYTNRALSGIGLLAVVLGGWFFAAGFEQPWSRGHMIALLVLISGLGLCLYGYSNRHRN